MDWKWWIFTSSSGKGNFCITGQRLKFILGSFELYKGSDDNYDREDPQARQILIHLLSCAQICAGPASLISYSF